MHHEAAELTGGPVRLLAREELTVPGALHKLTVESVDDHLESLCQRPGLGAAVRQALGLGLDRIDQRTRALGDQLRRRLDELPLVTTHDLGKVRCAIVTASVEGRSADEVAAALAREGINVSTTVPKHNQFDTEVRDVHPLVRLSPHYYNTEDDLDRALDVLARLAR